MAFTEPVAPAAVAIHVNPPIRTILAPTMAAYRAALVNPQFGDEIVLTPGVTYAGAVHYPVPGGQVGGGVVSPAVVQVPMTLTYVSTPIALQRQLPPTLFVATETVLGDNYVTIRTSGTLPAPGIRVQPVDTAQMPILISDQVGGDYCISPAGPGVHHYRFVGLSFTTPQSLFNGAMLNMGAISGIDPRLLASYPHHISVESCYFSADEDFGVNKSIAMQGLHMQIKDTYITNSYLLGNGDANCVWFDMGPGPYLIDNCLLEGLGENFLCGAESNSGIPITPGFEYVVCGDITIRKSHFRRKYSWKSDEPTYRQPCNVVAVGTMSTTGTTLTLTDNQATPMATFGVASLVGHYVKCLSNNEVRKILSGSGTSFVLASAFSTNLVAQTFRWNTQELAGKNNFEVKGAQRMLVEDCIFEKGWGGQGTSFTFTPRRTADISDFKMRWCRWSNTLGMGWSNGDWEQGNGLTASHGPTNRFVMEQCLWEHTTGTRTLPGSNKAFTWNVAGIEWGRFAFQTQSITMQAGATTGTNITFTSNTAVLDTIYVGLQLRYGVGRGTITAVAADLKSATVTITTPFPDALVHPLYPGWRVGPAAFLDSTPYLIPDSARFEHLSIVGANSGFTYPTYLASNGPLNNPGVDLQPPVATNMIWRNNIQFAGTTPGSGTGFVGESNKYGKVAADFYLESASRDMRKNVLFGTNLVTGFNFGQYYTGDMEGGAGSGHAWGMHEPDHTGSGAGGSIGFTDYANGDYRLLVGSQYHNWGTDGTDPGCDITTLTARLVGVASPDTDVIIIVPPPPPPPQRAMAIFIAGEPNLPYTTGTTAQVTVTSTGTIFPTQVTLRRDASPTFGTMTPDPQVVGRFTFLMNAGPGAWGSPGTHVVYADGTYPDAVVLTVSDTVNVADPPPPPPPPGGTYPPAVAYSGSIAVPTLARPAYLGSVIDPVFGTKITRISSETMAFVGDISFLTHEYGKVQAWNSDMTLLKLMGANFILDATTYAVVGGPRGYHNESKWSHTDPDSIYYTTNNGQFHKWNVRTGADVNLRTFGSGVLYMGPYEGNLSKDDRWVCLTLGDTVFIYDILNNAIESTFSLTAKGGSSSIDWVSMSQSGNYVVIAWRGAGGFEDPRTVSYNRVGMGRVATVFNVGEHLDNGYNGAGVEVAAQTCGFAYATLANGTQITLPSGACGHVSTRNTSRPGYAYFSDQDSGSSTNELIAFKLDGSGLCERWCHLRTNRDNEPTQARGGCSPDGTRVIFNSEWTPGGTVYCYVGVRP